MARSRDLTDEQRRYLADLTRHIPAIRQAVEAMQASFDAGLLPEGLRPRSGKVDALMPISLGLAMVKALFGHPRGDGAVVPSLGIVCEALHEAIVARFAQQLSACVHGVFSRMAQDALEATKDGGQLDAPEFARRCLAHGDKAVKEIMAGGEAPADPFPIIEIDAAIRAAVDMSSSPEGPKATKKPVANLEAVK